MIELATLREIGRAAANADGKRKGITQKQGELIINAAAWAMATMIHKTGEMTVVDRFVSSVARKVKKLEKLQG